MLKVLILHGWHGSDAPHWQAWLAQSLVLENCIVSFPRLSDNANPDRGAWLQEALEAFEELRPDVVVVHSLANILWFHMCGHLGHPVQKLLLCAPPRDMGDISEVSTFFPAPVPDDLRAGEVLMAVSDNDPYMSLAESEALAEKLGIPLHILHDAGHINAASGFGPWPWVKDWILA